MTQAGEKEILVVASKVRDLVREKGCQSSGELVEAISERVHLILSEAIDRARANGRATVRPYDL